MKTSRVHGAVLLMAVLCLPRLAAAQSTYLIDTGSGGTSSIGASALFGTGATNCSPQPQCASSFNYVAARITLSEAVSVEGIELWIAGFGHGGSMDVKIREDVSGVPSVNAPPLFSANSIYSKRYTGLTDNFNVPRWVVFDQFEAVLAAGTYWITFEPVHGSNLNYSVPGGAPNPLQRYAYFTEGNNRWVAFNPADANSHFGIRVRGTKFPGVGFGTASRTILNGSTFGFGYDYDFINSGNRDFTRFGNEGPALTSSYIFVIPGGYVHGRGKLLENGLSAGAYASTDGGCALPSDCKASARGAGRGIAYRTFVNMGSETRTFRVNANLTGSFHRLGGTARGGVHVFDSDGFFAVLEGASVAPELFLLQADGIGRIADALDDISLARFFPGSVLASQVATANFPTDTVESLPMQTGFVTLAPGGTVTVLFDVAVYAPPGGDTNFGSTLLPAPAFFTDTAGQQIFDIVAVGPSSLPDPAAAAIALSPASATTALGNGHAVVATVTAANGARLSDVPVTFTIVSGPNAGVTQQLSTDTNGEVTFTYAGNATGTDTIRAAVGALTSSDVTNTWTGGSGGGGFNFSGFLSPVDGPPVVNIVKAGSAIPLKFSLGGYQGMNILAPDSPSSRQMSCDADAPSDVVVDTASAGRSGLTYDAESDRYVYVWKTDKAWAKSCRQLTLTLTDGSSHTALFSFAK